MLQLSVTFLGDGEAPLVATKIKVDGQEVKIPLALVLGTGPEPLHVVQGLTAPMEMASYARRLQELAMHLTENVLISALPPAPLPQPQELPNQQPNEPPLTDE